MMRDLQLALVVAPLVGGLPVSAFQEVLDQAQTETDLVFVVDRENRIWEQEITVGRAGLLTRVEFWREKFDEGVLKVFINRGSPWHPENGPFDFAGFVRGDESGWVSLDVRSAELNFDVGDTFTIIFAMNVAPVKLHGGGDPGLYEHGELWAEEHIHGEPGQYDLAFRTYVEPSGGRCTGREKLRAKCKSRKGSNTIKAKLKNGEPGAKLTFRLDGDPKSDRPGVPNNRGKAKVKFKKVPDGPHTVEVVDCGVSDDADC